MLSFSLQCNYVCSSVGQFILSIVQASCLTGSCPTSCAGNAAEKSQGRTETGYKGTTCQPDCLTDFHTDIFEQNIFEGHGKPAMALSKYRRTLRDRLSLDDSTWEFVVPDLPSSAVCDNAGYVKSCDIVANTAEQKLCLSLIRLSSNRAISDHTLSHFIHLTCADIRLRTQDDRSATFRESSEYLSRLLKAGIVLNGVRYSFYGHSNSQLKSRSCVLMAGSQKDVDEFVEHLGDFTKIKTVAKKAKRIGLLFSTADTVVSVQPERCLDVPDIERDGYNFTDGCGSISRPFARLLSQRKPIFFRNKRYHPSVFQIRYRGYKGVVTVDPKMSAEFQVELRSSMRKFVGGKDYSFAVVDYSRLRLRFLSSATADID